jgi:hypothetical protein
MVNIAHEIECSKGGQRVKIFLWIFLVMNWPVAMDIPVHITEELRGLNFQNKTQRNIQDLAIFLNPKIRGWLNYYGKINRRVYATCLLLPTSSNDKMDTE